MLALIAARGGSKGLPRKNLRTIAGRPMIAWAVAASLQARQVDRVIVSTEDGEIAGAARAAGAETPFMRPPQLSEDDVPAGRAVLHALERVAELEGRERRAVAIVQPNSPLVRSCDIDGAIGLFEASGASAVLSVTTASVPIEAVFSLDCDGIMRNSLRERYGVEPVVGRRQVHGDRYQITGSIVVVDVASYRQDQEYFYRNDNVRGFVVPKEFSVDVDDEADFAVAAGMMERGEK